MHVHSIRDLHSPITRSHARLTEPAAVRPLPSGAIARVRLMATTDLHMHLTSYDYFAGRPDPTVGLTRTAVLIARARAEARKTGALTLLFDNGDGLQGTPLADLVSEQPGRRHPLMRAFDHLKYDAIGLGNHDFNFGLKLLDSVLRQAPCPVLSSNMRRLCDPEAAGFAPFAILDRMVRADGADWPIRIGVLSFLPPQTAEWDAHLLEGEIEVDDILASARRWLPELRAAGCDIVVALAHSGLDDGAVVPGMENMAIPLAALDGIDAVVAGHTHLLLPGQPHDGLAGVDARRGLVHGTPVVMAGANGAHLGLIDLDLVAGADGRWMVARSASSLRPILRRSGDGRALPLIPEDQDLSTLLSEDHSDTLAMMGRPVGHSDVALHSYFTFFAHDNALALLAAAQSAAVRPHLAGGAADGLPLLSAAAPGKFGARAGPESFTDVPAGPLSLRHIADLHAFPNQLCAAILTGAEVLDWLEHSAGLFNAIKPGTTDQWLLDTAMPGHDFDVMFGLTYRIDLSAPPRYHPDGRLRDAGAGRIRDACWNGAPVAPDARFAVALNSYRASAASRVAALRRARPVPLPPIPIREALKAHVALPAGLGRPARPACPWRFAPMPGTRVRLRSGPGARAHLHELDGRGVRAGPVDRDGFLILDIPL